MAMNWLSVLVWISEVLLIQAFPFSLHLMFSVRDKQSFPVLMFLGSLNLLFFGFLRWLVELWQRRKRPDMMWLPWPGRFRLALLPLLSCVPLAVHLVIRYYDYDDSLYSAGFENLTFWWIAYVCIIVIRITDNLFSHREPQQTIHPANETENMIWVSEALLTTALLIGTHRVLSHLTRPDALPELGWGFSVILPASLFRWLIERRQKRESPDLIWLPWYKRMLLTLIPLLVCMPICVLFGTSYYDTPDPFEENAWFVCRLIYWGIAIPTVMIVRILDNLFSHRRAN